MQLLKELVPSQSGQPEAKDGEESSSWTWKPHLSGLVLSCRTRRETFANEGLGRKTITFFRKFD